MKHVRKQENVTDSKKRKYSIEEDPEMAQITTQGLYITMINMLKDLMMINILKDLVENVDNMHLKMGNFSKEMKTVMKNNMEMQQMRNTVWK